MDTVVGITHAAADGFTGPWFVDRSQSRSMGLRMATPLIGTGVELES